MLLIDQVVVDIPRSTRAGVLSRARSSLKEIADWKETVTLEIEGRSKLPDSRKKAFVLDFDDYGIRSGMARIPVRQALLNSTLKALGLYMDSAAQIQNTSQSRCSTDPNSVARHEHRPLCPGWIAEP